MTVTLSGLEAQISALSRMSEGAQQAAGDGLMKEVLIIAAESAREVPVDTGYLRGTEYEEGPEITSDGISAAIGYTTAYALRQHEDLSLHHNVGKAKYLSDPIKAHLDLIPRAVVVAINEANRGAV